MNLLHHGVVDTFGSVCATSGAYISVPIHASNSSRIPQRIATLLFEKLVNKRVTATTAIDSSSTRQGKIRERQNVIERGQNRSFVERRQNGRNDAGSDCRALRRTAKQRAVARL